MSKQQPDLEILGIEHLGLAAKDPAKAEWFFAEVLGLFPLGREKVESQGVETLIMTSHNMRKSPSHPFDQNNQQLGKLELLKDQENNGTIGNYIEKKGGGIHHLALRVRDLQKILAHLSRHGIELINKTPSPGVQGTKIAFVHPRSTGGILVEFVECPPATD